MMPRRGPLARRSPLRRGKPLSPVNPIRGKKRLRDAFGGARYVAWLTALPCVDCGAAGRNTPSHACQRRSQGGTWYEQVPQCAGCHRSWDERTVREPFRRRWYERVAAALAHEGFRLGVAPSEPPIPSPGSLEDVLDAAPALRRALRPPAPKSAGDGLLELRCESDSGERIFVRAKDRRAAAQQFVAETGHAPDHVEGDGVAGVCMACALVVFQDEPTCPECGGRPE